jgi:hypothetical protein
MDLEETEAKDVCVDEDRRNLIKRLDEEWAS